MEVARLDAIGLILKLVSTPVAYVVAQHTRNSGVTRRVHMGWWCFGGYPPPPTPPPPTERNIGRRFSNLGGQKRKKNCCSSPLDPQFLIAGDITEEYGQISQVK